ncbi:MAG: hypothetical protein JWR43_1218, partial [Phenylobacterium sp.]|nr:hypothetical protein [Phenylobacterium sp.]
MGEVERQKILPPLSPGLRPLATFPPCRGKPGSYVLVANSASPVAATTWSS